MTIMDKFNDIEYHVICVMDICGSLESSNRVKFVRLLYVCTVHRDHPYPMVDTSFPTSGSHDITVPHFLRSPSASEELC